MPQGGKIRRPVLRHFKTFFMPQNFPTFSRFCCQKRVLIKCKQRQLLLTTSSFTFELLSAASRVREREKNENGKAFLEFLHQELLGGDRSRVRFEPRDVSFRCDFAVRILSIWPETYGYTTFLTQGLSFKQYCVTYNGQGPGVGPIHYRLALYAL